MSIFSQCAHPQGWVGRFFLTFMNVGHAKPNNWGLSHLDIQPGDRVLDIGCGGGAVVGQLLKRAGHVTGVDYMAESVRKATSYNQKAVTEGRCTIEQANVRQLPFADALFDKVTACETIYFWPEIVESFKQVRRVLKPGGAFLICCEDDGTSADYKKWETMVDGMKIYTVQELQPYLVQAGFKNIQIDVQPKHKWLAIISIA